MFFLCFGHRLPLVCFSDSLSGGFQCQAEKKGEEATQDREEQEAWTEQEVQGPQGSNRGGQRESKEEARGDWT